MGEVFRTRVIIAYLQWRDARLFVEQLPQCWPNALPCLHHYSRVLSISWLDIILPRRPRPFLRLFGTVIHVDSGDYG